VKSNKRKEGELFMGLADLHIHSIHSHDGTGSISAILKYVADQTRLDVIAITDHDTVSGIAEALRLAPSYGIEVVPGCEISTANGHLLGLFITESVPAGLSLEETLRRVGSLGGLCIAPHPEARGTSSLSWSLIRKTLSNPELSRILVGVEAFNGGLVYTRSNLSAAREMEDLDTSRIGNSDSHILQTLGEGSTEFLGSTAADLRRALEQHATNARIGKGLQGAQALRHWLPSYALRRLGWVRWNAHPQRPMQFARTEFAMHPSVESV